MRAAGIALLIALSLQGCGTLGRVEVWEKGYLARRSMTLDVDHEARSAERVYSSKEGVSGGFGVGGGGCGCN